MILGNKLSSFGDGPVHSNGQDCGETWNRLFDHRPFLSGEILYCQEEFEVKRNDREVNRLFEVLERTTEIRDSHTHKILSLTEESLPSWKAKLETALSCCNDILNNEDKYNIDINLEVNREIRKSEWEQFGDEIKTKYTSIDQTFVEKEQQLIEFYSDLEKRFHIQEVKEVK